MAGTNTMGLEASQSLMPHSAEAKKHRCANLGSLTIKTVSSITRTRNVTNQAEPYMDLVGRTGLEPVTDGL
jgi:hypothetical protein